MTAETVAEYEVVLCVKDTTFLDNGSIEVKKGMVGRHIGNKVTNLESMFEKSIKQLKKPSGHKL